MYIEYIFLVFIYNIQWFILKVTSCWFIILYFYSKNDIIDISRKIDTYETSILPYEDCCTVFTPKHPHTKPKPGQCEAAEKDLDIEPLIERAIAGIEYSYIE